jgi:dihydropteroate synthase
VIWRCGELSLTFDRPLVMGILNVTPDSFSDGGTHTTTAAAVAYAHHLVGAGADIIDVGGESTRPGAEPVPVDIELARVIPVIEALATLGVPVSIDSVKPAVMSAALAAGAVIVNDVNAMRAEGAVEVVAASGCGIVLAHMRGEPRTMQDSPVYADVVGEVTGFLRDRMVALAAAGVDAERVVVDPGIGFGKTIEHNLELLRHLGALGRTVGRPVLIGLSRKGFIGTITGRPVHERDAGSIAGALAAVQRGALVVRVHDVQGTCDALAVWRAVAGPDQRVV